MNPEKLWLLLLTSHLLVGCSSIKESKKIDVRQGDTVNQICFANTVDSWKPLKGESDTLILTKSLHKEYKVKLSGMCDTRNATFGIVTKGLSNCLSIGDEIVMTDGFNGHDSCRIVKIYQWLPVVKTKEVM